MKALASFLVLALAAVAACREDVPDDASSTQAIGDEARALLVTDPGSMSDLEARGLSLAGILGVQGGAGSDLAASPTYARIVTVVDHDLKVMHAQDPSSGVGVDHPHRLFDAGWLRSPQSRFELVGVVNRLDRMHAGGCGELRLIYRLAYTASRSASRLPMTMNVVYTQPDDGATCRTVAEHWLEAGVAGIDKSSLGPLKQIEIDFQASRWPSNERPEMGGQAEYVLRVFRPDGDAVVPAPLENTPRTDLDAADREELRGWVREHLADIDDGTAIVPDKFLATQATSVSPRGLARMANRAYSQLFDQPGDAFGDLDFSATKQIKSVGALLRRLDTMTCHGCHESRSIAGFHLLGEERDPAARVNALAVGRSPHFTEELGWRADFLHAVAGGQRATLVAPRPFAEHATDAGTFGAHCGLRDAGLAGWTCAAGLGCVDVDGTNVGMCLPADGSVGDICDTGVVTPNPDPQHDHVTSRRELTCIGDATARCDSVDQGFPDGMCRTDCASGDVGKVSGGSLPDSSLASLARRICGLVPSATALSQCLAAHRPFTACLGEQNTATFLRACDAATPCRDDYACARVENGPADAGACMPPYFAFQVRVDGHLFDSP